MIRLSLPLILALLFPLVACGGGDSSDPDAGVLVDGAPAPDGQDEPDGGTGLTVPETYSFTSRFMADTSSVAYTGQTFRHVLINDLVAYVEALTTDIDSGAAPADGEVLAALNFYYEFDMTTGAEVDVLLATTPPVAQATYGDFASAAKLREKVAGAEPATDHKDWSTQFRGWSEGGATSPDALVLHWFGVLDELAHDRGLGTIPTDPAGDAIGKVYVTAQGQDIKQLVQKFLLMSITFHQATDKYLDSATDGKGLKSPNTQETDKPYSTLEHAWDEGFGYFGAARDYALRTDEENASPGYADTDGDEAIDLKSEYNFGASSNAVKRDVGSDASAPTDFSGTAIQAFLRGRALIASIDGELDADQLAELEEQRDLAVSAWEQAIAATIVHYLNEVLADMDAFGSNDYNFLDHAKHWSEMKGFSLGLQFNPSSPLGDDEFDEFHSLVGDAPVLPDAAEQDIDAYRANLLAARDLLEAAYGFAEANVAGW